MRSQNKAEQEKVNRRFAGNLRRIREDRGLSQEAMADLAGIHRTEASLLERAGREPRLGTLVKLGDALEVPLSDLLHGIGWEPFLQRESSSPGRFRVAPTPKKKPPP